MECVYSITNIINNKKYIGQTNNYEKRKKEHLRASEDLSNHLPLYEEMRFFGIENFKFEILEECNDINKRWELEDYYIKKFDTIIDNNKGYNTLFGGKHGKSSKKFFERQKKVFFKKGTQNISFNLKGEDAFASKPVLNFTKQISYGSLRECALKEYGNIKYVKNISSVCNPDSNKFSYKNNIYYLLNEDGTIIPKNKTPLNFIGKIPIKETISGKNFESIQAAADYFGLSSSMIRDRIYHRIKNDKYKGIYNFEINN